MNNIAVYFVVVVTILQITAGVFYAAEEHWNDAAFWFTVAVANIAMVTK